MTARPTRRRVIRSERHVGTIYQRLEAARKKRAEVLATAKPANVATPDAPKRLPKTVAGPSKEPAGKRFPVIKNVEVESVTAPVKRRAIWPYGVLATVMLGWLAYTYESRATLQLAIPSTAAPNGLTAPVQSQLTAPALLPTVTAPQPLQVKTITADGQIATAPQIEGPAEKPRIIQEAAPLPAPVAGGSAAAPIANGPEKPMPSAPTTFATAPSMDPGFSFNNPPREFRVAFHIPRSATARAVKTARDGADAIGIDLGGARIVNFRIRSTHIRYFHADDRERSLELAKAIGAEARDFTTFTQPPPEGYVELWIAGRPAAAQRRLEPGLLGGLRQDLRQMGADFRGAIRSSGR